MARIESEELLTVSDVASWLGIHKMTVYRLCWRGRLPHTRIGRTVRVRRDDVRALIGNGVKADEALAAPALMDRAVGGRHGC